jgi:propionyl-CoA carboxylase alpha chain
VEFLVDSQRKFYFLEMNTRLQVEHAITECITGIDIVHQMIRAAKGHKLLHKQADIPVDGWALECRVYAEDPYKAFGLPSVGRLSRYVEPTHIPHVRCDSGITEGSEISIYYDPMICKLVTYGPTRTDALATMTQALDSYVIRGVTHNVPLLRDVITEKRFVAGDISTKYLPQVYPDGFKGKTLTESEERHLLAIAGCIVAKRETRARSHIDTNKVLEEVLMPTEWSLQASVGDKAVKLHVRDTGNEYQVTLGGKGGETLKISRDFTLASPVISATINGQREIFQLMSRSGSHLKLQYFGTVFTVGVLEQHYAQFLQYMPIKKALDLSSMVIAPMPGVVKSVAVKVGDMVSEGQEMLVLEAMKMQNSLVAGKQGKVKTLNVKEGQTVSDDDVLVELE